MIILYLLLCFCLAVLISELFSFGRVFYTRLILFIFILFSLNIIFINQNIIYLPRSLLLGYFLSNIPLIVAWFGFRVHLSNSITLVLLSLIGNNSLSKTKLYEMYNVPDHIKSRVAELSKGGYLDNHGFLTQDKKSKLVLLMINFLRS